jgi:hypothetical protein
MILIKMYRVYSNIDKNWHFYVHKTSLLDFRSYDIFWRFFFLFKTLVLTYSSITWHTTTHKIYLYSRSPTSLNCFWTSLPSPAREKLENKISNVRPWTRPYPWRVLTYLPTHPLGNHPFAIIKEHQNIRRRFDLTLTC